MDSETSEHISRVLAGIKVLYFEIKEFDESLTKPILEQSSSFGNPIIAGKKSSHYRIWIQVSFEGESSRLVSKNSFYAFL